MDDTQFRIPNLFEAKILARIQRLIERKFPDYRINLTRVYVRLLDELGSLEFQRNDDISLNVPDGPLINAIQSYTHTKSDYGHYINFIVLARDGFLCKLQIYKDDGASIENDIDPDKINLI